MEVSAWPWLQCFKHKAINPTRTPFTQDLRFLDLTFRVNMFERTDMIQITKAYTNHPKKGWLTTLVIFTSSCGAKHGEILSVSVCVWHMLPHVASRWHRWSAKNLCPWSGFSGFRRLETSPEMVCWFAQIHKQKLLVKYWEQVEISDFQAVLRRS